MASSKHEHPPHKAEESVGEFGSHNICANKLIACRPAANRGCTLLQVEEVDIRSCLGHANSWVSDNLVLLSLGGVKQH